MTINLYAAWAGFLLGSLAGATTGLFFHAEDWLGGYAGWRRRMVRLGHVAFFGIGLLNLGFALTVSELGLVGGLALASGLLLFGAGAMPLVCYLSAWRKGFRHLFFLPAGAVALAIALVLWRMVFR
jgi:hypothetical protein